MVICYPRVSDVAAVEQALGHYRQYFRLIVGTLAYPLAKLRDSFRRDLPGLSANFILHGHGAACIGYLDTVNRRNSGHRPGRTTRVGSARHFSLVSGQLRLSGLGQDSIDSHGASSYANQYRPEFRELERLLAVRSSGPACDGSGGLLA